MRTPALALALSLIATAALAAPAATVAMKGPTGADMGTVTIDEGPGGVVLHLELKGLTPGWHAVHFHAMGMCSDPKFTSAGGHVNTADKKPHGLLNPQGPDLGDLPNIWADKDGKVMAEIYSPFVSAKDAAGRANLLDADGSAIVVHANPDDYVTQPIGGAGARVACGVVKAG